MKTSVGLGNHPIIEKIGVKNANLLLLGVSLLLLYIFYISQNLFFVNGLNDFDEYFIRAEMWVNGERNWGGGTDKLLSFLEFFTISIFQHDFLAFYKATNIIIASLLFIAVFIFVFKDNDLFPSFTVKYFAAIFLLSMPYFIFRNLNLDASALLGIMLLFFLSTYRNPYMGWIGVLIYLSRPEGLIIVALYIFFLILDKKYRKKIAINFLSYIVLLVVYKWLVAKFLLNTAAVIGVQEVDSAASTYVEKGIATLILDAFKGIIQIPQYLFLYGMEILQNKILFIFYLIGLVVSIFNKKMLVFLVLVGGYAFMYMGLNQFQNPFEFNTAFDVFASKMEWLNKSIEIANGRNMEFNLYGHTRYRVFFYPAIAFIVIAGVTFTIQKLSVFFFKEKKQQNITNGKKFKKQVLKKKEQIIEKKSGFVRFVQFFSLNALAFNQKIAIASLTILFVFMNLIAYAGFSKPYKFKNQMADVYMNDYYKLGFEIRKKMKPNDIVFMPNICNCNRAFIAEFIIFSGTRYTLLPICEGCNDHLVYGHPEKKQLIRADEIDSIIPSRNVFFDRYAVDYQKTFNDTTARRIRQLYQKFDLNMLDSLNIHFVLTPQELNKPGLNMIKEIGQVKLYENIPLKKLIVK